MLDIGTETFVYSTNVQYISMSGTGSGVVFFGFGTSCGTSISTSCGTYSAPGTVLPLLVAKPKAAC